MAKIIFFKTPSAWRQWLKAHHDSTQELSVGFYKKDSGKPSITWPEAVDEALCFGWIDGVRKTIDDISYTIRFTPRKPGSKWSSINVKRVEDLIKTGRMRPPGLKAFAERKEEKSEQYSYEQKKGPKLDHDFERKLRTNKKAWMFFQAQAPSYQRKASWWVMSAKKDETRQNRLGTLIEASQKGRRLDERSK